MSILSFVPPVRMAIKAALIDLSGTLHVEDKATHNAVQALCRLRDEGNIAIKFVTNTTKESSKTLYDRLKSIGFNIAQHEIYSSLSAAAEYVKKNNLNPFYLISSDARIEFPAESTQRPLDSVVVGLAPTEFHYENLNKAFRILMENEQYQLIAIHQGKFYKTSQGLALGPGCFSKGLEYVTNKQAIVIGKPNSYFFKSAIPDGLFAEDCVMIGDDARDDVEGAMNVGFKGILVKTGKYLPNVVQPPPTALVENFDAAVDWIIQHNASLNALK